MGNHSLDCCFCGRDQRVYGRTCCPEYVEQERQKNADVQAAVDADTAYLAKFGLHTEANALGRRTKLSAKDVVAFLKRHEDKIPKPAQAPCTCSPILPWDSDPCPRHG